VARSRVPLPPEVRSPFEVYLNGVRQDPTTDYRVEAGALVFDRALRKDKISGWRWFLGAWGVGTYRQNDSIDVRYSAQDGSSRVAEGLEIDQDNAPESR
jgi:hypothetical protein